MRPCRSVCLTAVSSCASSANASTLRVEHAPEHQLSGPIWSNGPHRTPAAALSALRLVVQVSAGVIFPYRHGRSGQLPVAAAIVVFACRIDQPLGASSIKSPRVGVCCALLRLRHWKDVGYPLFSTVKRQLGPRFVSGPSLLPPIVGLCVSDAVDGVIHGKARLSWRASFTHISNHLSRRTVHRSCFSKHESLARARICRICRFLAPEPDVTGAHSLRRSSGLWHVRALGTSAADFFFARAALDTPSPGSHVQAGI